MQGRGQVGKTHDLKTIVKRSNRQKVWFSEVGEAGLLQKGPFWMTEAEAAAAEGLLLFCTREVVLKAVQQNGNFGVLFLIFFEPSKWLNLIFSTRTDIFLNFDRRTAPGHGPGVGKVWSEGRVKK